MMTPKFQEALENYHKRKWFPDLYPNALQEFSDYVSAEMIRNLFEDWNTRNDPSTLGAAEYLQRMLPVVKSPDLYAEFRRAMDHPLQVTILPDFAYYYIRSSEKDQSVLIWNKLRDWCEEWDTVLKNWLHAEISADNQLPQQPVYFEKQLQDTRELFSWKIQKDTKSLNSLDQLLRLFRLDTLDAVADWNDFPALAKSIAEAEAIGKTPQMRRSEQDAVQFTFPIDPPTNVLLQYGKAAGPVDVLRFLAELGRGFFYSGMDPGLPPEQRICGDSSLPHFWGYVQAMILADPDCLNQLIGLRVDRLAEQMNLVLEFWFRYETFLSLYRNTVRERFAEAQDFYVANFQLAFPFDAPHFLYLYDLSRSNESAARATALHAAFMAVERFRELYGTRWFANARFSRRIRDYWWLGFSLTLQDVLRDLGL